MFTLNLPTRRELNYLLYIQLGCRISFPVSVHIPIISLLDVAYTKDL